MTTKSILQKYLFTICLCCKEFLSLAGKTKPPRTPEADVTENQQKGEIAMLVIQVRLLGSALCLPPKDVLSYVILSHIGRIKDEVNSKEQQAKFNPFPMAAQQLIEVTAKCTGVLLCLMPCSCSEELRKVTTFPISEEWYCKPLGRHACVLKHLCTQH